MKADVERSATVGENHRSDQPDRFRIRNWSVIGLGKLGLCVAAAWADRGFGVVGYDLDQRARDGLLGGPVANDDPDLPGMLERSRGRLSAAADIDAAVLGTDATFVIVPTPSDSDGGYSLKHVKVAFQSIGRSLRSKRAYHLVVLGSTVMPGAVRGELLPILEAESGKVCAVDFGLCYNPEFVAIGQVLRDLLQPSLVLIGEHDRKAGDILAVAWRAVLGDNAPISRMSIENAELAKLALNAFVTMKISFANTIADLCEKLPGGDVDQVLGAIGNDPRIGRRALKGGLGYGGPCFPRDSIALSRLAANLEVAAPLAAAADEVNRRRPHRVLSLLGDGDLKGRRVGVVGLSYRTGTTIVEASQGLEILRDLLAAGTLAKGYDRLAAGPARLALGMARGDGATGPVVDDLNACVTGSEAIILATEDRETVATLAAILRGTSRPMVVVDVWRTLDPEAMPPMIRFLAPGRGPEA